MLKREIKYKDFDDNDVVDIFYFNLSKPELFELEVQYEKGFQALLEEIVKTEDRKQMFEIFKTIILMAYGEKSPDGKHFLKSDEMRERFSQSAAYQSLFMELIENEKIMTDFINAIMPKGLGAEVTPTGGNLTKLPPPPGVPTPPTS